MAKKKRKGSKSKKTKRAKSNQIPISVLKNRLGRLSRIVAQRDR